MPSALYQPFHIGWPQGSAQAGNTVNYYFWLPYAWRLAYLQAYARTPNTVGTHTLSATDGAAASVLSGANFNLNTLVANTVTSLGLATGSPLEFAADEVLTLSVVSNNAGFDGSGLYFLVGTRS